MRFKFDPRLLTAGIKGGFPFQPVSFPEPGRYSGLRDGGPIIDRRSAATAWEFV